MTELGFGHKNALHATLLELARHTEELTGMLTQPDSPHRILPVTAFPVGKERERLLNALTKVRRNIEAMCHEFGIEFPPMRLQEKMANISDYMYATGLNMRPKYLVGYGELTDEEQATISFHVERILESLAEI
jgi:hypothetical protein